MSAIAAVALPLALGLTLPGVASAALPVPASPVPTVPAAATPQGTTASGATVDHVEWATDRQLVVYINSKAMGRVIPIGVVLPRSWNANPGATFPAVYYLDGFRAADNYSDWYVRTDFQQFFKSREALAVTTFGGAGSFFSDWKTTDPNAGVQGTMQWEKFIATDVPQILKQSFRANDSAGIAGLSMGGTAAYNIAQHHPGQYAAAQSFSGYLNTTAPYLPQILQYSVSSNTPFNPDNLWGTPTVDLWPYNDPAQHVSDLAKTKLYAYAGGGAPGFADEPSPFPGLSSNYAGSLLEILAQYSTRNFLDAAQGKVSVNNELDTTGTHSWPYWDQQYKKAWPDMASVLGIAADNGCGVGTQFAGVAGAAGGCKSNFYNVTGGTAQDMSDGRAFSSDATGTHLVHGLIGAKYQALGGTQTSGLGLPTSDEITATGGGAVSFFQNGAIFYSAATGAHVVYGAILADYAKQGYEKTAGYPTADESATGFAPGRYQTFENGPIYYSAATGPKTGAHYISGPILAKWGASGYENGSLGFPTTDEVLGLRNGQGALGSYQAFEKDASIYLSQATPASIITGPVIAAWGTKGYEVGQYGYPNSDTAGVPGGVRNTFQFGAISIVNGQPVFS